MKSLIFVSILLGLNSQALAEGCSNQQIRKAAIAWGEQTGAKCTLVDHKVIYANAENEKHSVKLTCDSAAKTVDLSFRIDGQTGDCILKNGRIY